MKISEVILDLETFRFNYGDVDVVTGDWDEPELTFSNFHYHLVIH